MNYSSDLTKHLSDLKGHVQRTIVAPAASWRTVYLDKGVKVGVAAANFIADPSEANANAYAELRAEEGELHSLVGLLEGAGGPEAMGAAALSTPEVNAVFADAFAEKIKLLQALVEPAKRGLGHRRMELTIAGAHEGDIRLDPVVGAWANHAEHVRAALAANVFNERYCRRNGEGWEKKSFDGLFSELVAPIPQAPTS